MPNFPLLSELHQQKEEFREIFEPATGWADGTFRLLDWLSNIGNNFKESADTIKRWMSEIIGYFDGSPGLMVERRAVANSFLKRLS